MAFLELRDGAGGSFRVAFRQGGRLHRKSIATSDPVEAEAIKTRVEENLRLMARGRLVLPDGADLATFLISDGKVTGEAPRPPRSLALSDLAELYEASAGEGMEANTRATLRIHARNLASTLGGRFQVPGVTIADLERHVARRRSTGKGRAGKPLSADTIRKEIRTFGAMWKWAERRDLVEGVFPSDGLVYPKTSEKLPFLTRAEVEARIARGVTAGEADELWGALFLTLDDIRAVLEVVKGRAGHPWIYPMFALAAHTGARRSEILRAKVSDFDLEAGTLLVREKKKAKGRTTTRRVPASPFLSGVISGWISAHPGGPSLIATEAVVARSRTRSPTTGHGGAGRPTDAKSRAASVRVREGGAAGPVTVDESNHHFQQALKGTEWAVIRGWHVFRHSFASNCAAKGVDQRIIDDWMGHQTEEMRRRYRHLFPDQQAAAIRSVFS